MKEEVILLLDSYYNVILWYGDHIQSWYEEGFQNQKGYEHIKDLFEKPKQDIDIIMDSRFPVPISTRRIQTVQRKGS